MEEKSNSFRAVKNNKGGFNAVDMLIIVIFVGIIVVFVISRITLKANDKEDVRLEFTVLVENVDEDFYGKINVGDRVFDSSDGGALGYVSKIDKSGRYFVYRYDSESEQMRATEYPDKYNFQITVSTDASFVEDVGYSVDGKRIAVGRKLELRFPQYSCGAVCTDVDLLM